MVLASLARSYTVSDALSRLLGKREQLWLGANGTSALAACFDAILVSKETRVRH
jgi:hypothetical protein